MRITVTVEDPDGPFQDRLLALLSEHADSVEVDTAWTTDRAARYYLSLPTNARRIVEEAAARDGYVPADELRADGDGSLRGQSGALKRAVERGVRAGWWPEGVEQPIQPQGPGFGKVAGYRMPSHLVGVFFTAIAEAKLGTQRACLEKAVREDTGSWNTKRAVTVLADAGHEVADKRARQILRDLAANGLLVKTDPGSATYRTTTGED